MTELPERLKQALSAYTPDAWSEVQHRKVKRRLQAALPLDAEKAPRFNASGRIWALAGAAVAVAVAVTVGWLWLRLQSPATESDGVMATASVAVPSSLLGASAELGSDEREARGIFGDGSTVLVERGGKLNVSGQEPSETRLRLIKGRFKFDVQKQPERTFVAVAEGVEVRVVGTRFEVELDQQREPHRVRVSVMNGVVEVRDNAGATTRLTAGQVLDVATASAAIPSNAAKSPSVNGSAASASPSSDAASLFAAASTARASGQVGEAARLYALLLERFPRDQRAGLAALELGRLRLDAQGDAGRAAAAFRRAIQSAPNESLREDASARLVEALDAMNQGAPCRAERTRYLARYPRGVHAASVRQRCVER